MNPLQKHCLVICEKPMAKSAWQIDLALKIARIDS